MRILKPAWFVLVVAGLYPSTASAKDMRVRVDSHSAPWSTGTNSKLAFGMANARPATVVLDRSILPGIRLKFSATGTTTTEVGGAAFGPDGEQDWPMDRGAALFPSHYISHKHGPVYLNELVGCFIDADGKVVGEPFAIGAKAEVEVPQGASALSLGINDDNYSDNTGTIVVAIHIPEASVTVESSNADQ